MYMSCFWWKLWASFNVSAWGPFLSKHETSDTRDCVSPINAVSRLGLGTNFFLTGILTAPLCTKLLFLELEMGLLCTALLVFPYQPVYFSNNFYTLIFFWVWALVRVTPYSVCSFSPDTQIKKKCRGSGRSSCQTSPMATVEAAAQEAVACLEEEAAVLALVRRWLWGKRFWSQCLWHR